MTESDLLFDVASGVAVVTLNRPDAMNALTLPMIHTLTAQLRDWASDESITAVVVRGAGDRAFCAGGDIRALYDAREEEGGLTETFFRAEYRLDHLVYHYPKPYVALMDGIVMGGGVGISLHGRYRVVCEKTMFAMPETGIGLFPDVGASYFLPRLPGELGMFLGLTGHRLRAADCMYAGIGDYFIPVERHDEIVAALRDGGDIAATLSRLSEDAGAPPLRDQRDWIDRCFGADSVSEIWRALENEDSDDSTDILKVLRTKSPLGCMMTYRQVRAGATMDFDACMKMEYRMSQRVMAGHDFFEGVRALIIDKDNQPEWRPGALSDVTLDMVAEYFAPPPQGDLTFDAI
jgi:enoyl-CoA hydratase